MRKIVATLTVIFLLSAGAFAQGNLQFNAVKYYELTVTQVGTTLYTESTQSITVPSGKVWKIESCVSNVYTSSNNNSSILSGQAGRILLNGRILYEAGYVTGNSLYSTPILPMWLPAGTYTLSIKSSSLGNGVVANGTFSAIEFNVVP